MHNKHCLGLPFASFIRQILGKACQEAVGILGSFQS